MGAASLGAAAGRLLRDGPGSQTGTESVPFYGPHQAGITTPSQGFLQFAAFDVTSSSREDLRQLLQSWSAAAAALTGGQPVGPLVTGDAAPVDPGEAVGSGASRLTITFGFGPGLFGNDRFGLSARRPAPLIELPEFAGDALQPPICGGDLAVQACAEDPQVAFHAVHSLIRLGSPTAVPRWSLAGFGRTSTSRSQQTGRNLMGFKDGTGNVMAEEADALRRFVWAGEPESPSWMRDGSYMVVRRIRMLMGAWDATALNDQERTFGRHKLSGAPLGRGREHDPLDLDAQVGGLPLIPSDAHVRVAGPGMNDGQRILRRGYSYLNGIDPAAGAPDVGLLFVCFQRDPRVQFVPIQRRLSVGDALNRHIEHIGSAIFACPPGTTAGRFVGETLLA